jgi:hypothetical protein
MYAWVRWVKGRGGGAEGAACLLGGAVVKIAGSGGVFSLSFCFQTTPLFSIDRHSDISTVSAVLQPRCCKEGLALVYKNRSSVCVRSLFFFSSLLASLLLSGVVVLFCRCAGLICMSFPLCVSHKTFLSLVFTVPSPMSVYPTRFTASRKQRKSDEKKKKTLLTSSEKEKREQQQAQ